MTKNFKILLVIIIAIFPYLFTINGRTAGFMIFTDPTNTSTSNNPTTHLPEVSFSCTYGDKGFQVGYDFIQTSDGDYVLVGITNSSSAGGNDMWLVKIDVNGEIKWNRTFGGQSYDSAMSIVVTSDGGYALAGYTLSYGAGNGDMWLVKTNSIGHEEWNRTYGGTSMDSVSRIIQTADDGFALTGVTSSYGAGNGDMWLVKINSTGHEEWNRTYGGSNMENAKFVLATPDSGYILAGSTRSYGVGMWDMWLVKTNSTGHEEWNRTYGGTESDIALSISATPDGGYALAGYTDSSGNGNRDMLLIKTNSTGHEEWSRTFGGNSTEYCYSVVVTADRGYALTGWTDSYGAGSNDMWLVKTDENGYMKWNQTFGGENDDGAFSIVSTSDGEYTLVGYTYSYGAGDADMWLVKTEIQDNANNNIIGQFTIFLFGSFLVISILFSGVITLTIIIRKSRTIYLTKKHDSSSYIQDDSVISDPESELPNRTSTSPKPFNIQNTPYNDLIAEERSFSKDLILSEMDSTSLKTPDQNISYNDLIAEERSFSKDSILSEIGSTSLTTPDVDVTKEKGVFSSITLQKLDIGVPLVVNLLTPLFWIISQILYPPQIRKLSKTKVYNNPLRQQILVILSNHKFIHYGALKRQLNCGTSIFIWHLRVLEDFGLIERRKFGKALIFFLKGSFLDEYKLKIYCTIRNKITLMILEFFLDKENDPWEIDLLSKQLDKSQRGIRYHCDKLLSLGLFEKPVHTNHYRLVKKRKHYVKWLIDKHRLEQLT